MGGWGRKFVVVFMLKMHGVGLFLLVQGVICRTFTAVYAAKYFKFHRL